MATLKVKGVIGESSFGGTGIQNPHSSSTCGATGLRTVGSEATGLCGEKTPIRERQVHVPELLLRACTELRRTVNRLRRSWALWLRSSLSEALQLLQASAPTSRVLSTDGLAVKSPAAHQHGSVTAPLVEAHTLALHTEGSSQVGVSEQGWDDLRPARLPCDFPPK